MFAGYLGIRHELWFQSHPINPGCTWPRKLNTSRTEWVCPLSVEMGKSYWGHLRKTTLWRY